VPGAGRQVPGGRFRVTGSRGKRGLAAWDCGQGDRGQVETDDEHQVPVSLPSGYCSLPRVLPPPLGPIAGDEVDNRDQCL
jgi:hypothetical protein